MHITHIKNTSIAQSKTKSWAAQNLSLSKRVIHTNIKRGSTKLSTQANQYE